MVEWVIIECFNNSSILLRTIKINTDVIYCDEECLTIPEGTCKICIKIIDDSSSSEEEEEVLV